MPHQYNFTKIFKEFMKAGTNTAVFILFFGMALLETIQERNWIKAALWLAIGVVFLLGDNIKLKAKKN